MNAESNLSQYIAESKSLNDKKFGNEVKISILSSFTLEGLSETLIVKCAEKDIKCKTFVSGYNQYNQEILKDNSQLHNFSPEITFLILDPRKIFGSLFYNSYELSKEQRIDFVNKKFNEIKELIDFFKSKSKSKLVISNFWVPTYSPYGISETKTEFGFREMIKQLNQNLLDKVQDEDSVYLLDMDRFVSKYGEENTFDFQQYFFGDIQISIKFIPHLANELMSFVIAYLGISKKCIVLDLDNTLWGGIAGEDGVDGIKLGHGPPGNAFLEFQEHLLSLFHRGIILAVNSKNNPEDALKIFREHPNIVLKEDNFANLKINWNDKVENMNEIAKELNIGLDSIVYFDDDPINREFMKMALPQVKTVELPDDPSQFSKILQNLNEFSSFVVTKEDSDRGKMYSEQRKRDELKASVISYDEFLKNLGLVISIKKADDFTIPRISQLTLKTNQFNLTTKRYQEEDIRKFSRGEDFLVSCTQVEDKFGDNGITGVFIVKKDNSKEWIIDTFLLSCRIIGKEIEKTMMEQIFQQAKCNGVERIRAKFIPTQKNKPAEKFLGDCGFKKEGDFWVYDLEIPFKKPDFIEVKTE